MSRLVQPHDVDSRADRAPRRKRRAAATIAMWVDSPAAQVMALLAASVFSAAINWQNDGLWAQGDAPRHAATGLLYWDLVSSRPSDPLDFALSYYARYPILVPLVYPPLFHMIEGAAFGVFGPSPFVARALVLLFTLLAGIYTMLWGRRFIAPVAGWAGASMVLIPGVVLYSTAVLLNMPATALSLGALYHWRCWLALRQRRDWWAFTMLALAAVLTYYPSLLILPVALVWMFLTGERKRVLLFLGWSAAAVLVLIVVAGSMFPLLTSRNLPSMTRLLSSTNWVFYSRGLVRLSSVPWMAAGLIGLGAGLWHRRWRLESAALLLTYPTMIFCLAMLPAISDRYALLLAPITVLGAFVGVAIVAGDTRGRRMWVTSLVVAAAIALSISTSLSVRVPRVSGFDRVTDYLQVRGPGDAVLYDGDYDGVFGYYARIRDPQFARRLVLATKLLYRRQQGPNFEWIDTSHVSTASDVVSLIQRQSGCRLVVVEVGATTPLSPPQILLRQALEGSAFRKLQSFPVEAGNVRHLDVYEFTLPLAPAPPMDLVFSSFSSRVFRGIEPIPTRR